MPSSKVYLDYILDQISHAEGITARPMMGEYLLYSSGRLFGGVYDDRFLIKPTKSAKKMLPGAQYELPYEGAKEMLLVDITDDREFLARLVEAVSAEVPAPKKRK
ncbi:MAG: TfoX/Sxy family protein [Ruminococcus sp.]|nr:TfoX/Sxy family protein [Ruminococcus sp.]